MTCAVMEDTAVALFDWKTMGSVPERMKDGRDVLLWKGHLLVCSWCDGWRDPVGRLVEGATHWADVEGPGA